MQIKIRDYRGVERADIDLDKIALIAGQNEQGKTCVLEATRAALCGMAIPIPGVLKKDAKLLVRDGAERGYVTAHDDNDSAQDVAWPSAAVHINRSGEISDSEYIKCTDYASGFYHLLNLNLQERASVLASYIESTPTKEDIEAAARDAGYQEGAIAKIWESLEDAGYDATYRRARDYTVKLKGQWEEATGEKKYGAKKAADWQPETNPGTDREALVERSARAEQAVLDTAGAVAVSDAEIERLNRQVKAESEAENLIQLNDEISDIRASLDKWQNERSRLPDDPAKTPPGLRLAQAACPECGVVLVANYPKSGPLYLTTYVEEKVPEALSEEILERRTAMDKKIKEHKDEISELEGRISKANGLIATAEAARTRLKEIEKAPKHDEASILQAKEVLTNAQRAVRAFDAKARADKLHGDLVKNEKLIAILAPDGLRRRKLATKLDEFNARLATICASAAWPVVRLDEKLEGHYGTRPVWAASNSGQWRARAVLQIALTQIDGSAAVLLDEADMLDKRGRNGLFKALEVADVRAIVCMTMNHQDLVPNLKSNGMGHSYWIENGVCQEILGA